MNRSATENARMEELRKKGFCPHTMGECRRAKFCAIENREDGCVTAISGAVPSCRQCRRKSGSVCEFKCFRRTNDRHNLRPTFFNVKDARLIEPNTKGEAPL